MESSVAVQAVTVPHRWGTKRWKEQWPRAVQKRLLKGDGFSQFSQQKLLLLSALRLWQQQQPPSSLLPAEVCDMDALHKTTVPHPTTTRYSVASGASGALEKLWQQCAQQLPCEFSPSPKITFSSPSGNGDGVHFPTPLREQDAAAAIRALEASAVAAIGSLRDKDVGAEIEINLDLVSAFLMSAYLTTIDGMDKMHPEIKSKIPDTDLNKAQSILWRRLSANLYKAKDEGKYYHIHGSLEATTTLEMLGLPAFNPDVTDYHECIETIGAAVAKHTVAELDQLNDSHGQAGVEALRWEDFQATPHGQGLLQMAPLTVDSIEDETPPVPFAPWTAKEQANNGSHALAGIKVIEMCRVIAGPTIGRSLAAHGAEVIKVTSPQLPDVPFFQVDVNTGKRTVSLNLKCPADRKVFDQLLAEADVVIDGYRPGALDKFGVGPESLAALGKKRNRGYVYVSEDCFGQVEGSDWSKRPGWQQIADCVTGVAWEQGRFMGLDEPVVPPFPMSDYGTGALGCVAALAGLYKRATLGGSWECQTSLCQYDVFLLGLGLLPGEEQRALRREFTSPSSNGRDFFALRHFDSVDEVGKRALSAMKRVVPHLFSDEMMQSAHSDGFNGTVSWPKEAVKVHGLRVGHVRASRPNGFDGRVGWEEGWDV